MNIHTMNLIKYIYKSVFESTYLTLLFFPGEFPNHKYVDDVYRDQKKSCNVSVRKCKNDSKIVPFLCVKIVPQPIQT